MTLANREVIIREGEFSEKVFFILRGMIRGYFINRHGEERNIFLRPEGTFTGSPNCLFSGEPSRYTFESILETEILLFNYSRFLAMEGDHPFMAQLNRLAMIENLRTLISRVDSLVGRTPEERYLDLLKQNPQFFQKAFHKHIANYLGITAVSLSRIMKRQSAARNS